MIIMPYHKRSYKALHNKSLAASIDDDVVVARVGCVLCEYPMVDSLESVEKHYRNIHNEMKTSTRDLTEIYQNLRLTNRHATMVLHKVGLLADSEGSYAGRVTSNNTPIPDCIMPVNTEEGERVYNSKETIQLLGQRYTNVSILVNFYYILNLMQHRRVIQSRTS